MTRMSPKTDSGRLETIAHSFNRCQGSIWRLYLKRTCTKSTKFKCAYLELCKDVYMEKTSESFQPNCTENMVIDPVLLSF